ncbi:MAG TPA: response regulator, partial [Pyrinomonadaceae bacterium]
VGQAALELKRIVVSDAPSDYVQISSGLGEARPVSIAVAPIAFEGEVKGVLELAAFQPFAAVKLSLLDQLMESLGIVMAAIESQMRTDELLQQSQTLAEELQTQQEELQQTNEELEEKARQLTARNNEVERKNRAVELGRLELEEKAEQLALTSRYKSQFLANMSHELRTPLNSMLILSRQLAENNEETLTAKQVQFAETINSSGADLLSLINDILDLSKIESGMMTVEAGEVSFDDVTAALSRSFQQVAQDKGLDFGVETVPGLPPTIHTDEKRLQQVLKNLLSNAIKFTEEGRVGLRVEVVEKKINFMHEGLNRADTVIAFEVTDTGIGIPSDKQKIIFEAFQQADGTTSRKYGGTGLGLSISREIARLLGGEIRVQSEPGEGSTFTLYLPRAYKAPVPGGPGGSSHGGDGGNLRGRDGGAGNGGGGLAARTAGAASSTLSFDEAEVSESIRDDRGDMRPGERVLLIVEDDPGFAQILLDLAHEKGFKGLVATRGDVALGLARKYRPDAITLDIMLPDRDGWTVLDRLKHDAHTSHIPVHIISSGDAQRQRAIRMGAITQLQKPVSREQLASAFDDIATFVQRGVKRLLVVEDDDVQRMSIVELIGNGDVVTTAVASGGEALAALATGHFDCMVLDLKLPDMTGFELIERIQNEPGHSELPIIVYTGKELTEKEETQLRKVADAIIVKEVSSPERLLAETALFLHRVEANLPEPKRRVLEQMHRRDPVLAGKKVLVVDDDVRNIFALTSALESQNMVVVHAENGREAIEVLERTPGIRAILMDIMMPGMDGYETTAAIREMPQYKSLPIIALTAKAMKADRDRCIEAGASDYISKPLDIDQLLSLLRVWLYRQEGTLG